MITEWIRMIVGLIFLLVGLVIFGIEFYGAFRMKYALNRMHAAAIGDTLGIAMSLLGLIVLNGFTMVSLKLLLVIIVLWLTSPVSSHLIARLEFATSKEVGRYDLVNLVEGEKDEMFTVDNNGGEDGNTTH